MRQLMRPGAPAFTGGPAEVRPQRESRAPERQKPTPRWLMRLRGTGIVLGLLAAIGGGGYYAIDEGALSQVQGGLRDAGEVVSAKLGLVVKDAYSEGRHSVTSEALTAVVGPAIGHSIVLLDTEALREQIEHLPWVRSATVKRLLPSTLFISIDEYDATALWYDGHDTKVVSSDGEVLPVKDLRPFLDLTLLHGDGAPEASTDLLRVLKTEPDLAKRVTAAGRVGKRRWNVFLDGRVEVRLPEHGADVAWHRLAMDERSEKILERSIESIDLRAATWMAVRPKGDDDAADTVTAAAEKHAR